MNKEEKIEFYLDSIYKTAAINQSLILLCLYMLGIKEDEITELMEKSYKKINEELEKIEELEKGE